MKFFKPGDFDDIPINDTWDTSIVADRANAKLEREAKVVYGGYSWTANVGHPTKETHGDKVVWDEHKGNLPKFTALLVCVEALEICNHPEENLRILYPHNWIFKCECGAKVKPKVFEAVE